MVRVNIEDKGPGIDPEKIQHVFRPFFTTKKEGLGMGLSVCKSIVESHGGKISVENNPEGGATFYFILPVSEESSTCH
jgi:signal transduction histidine kinase